jgi:hypothetical protein
MFNPMLVRTADAEERLRAKGGFILRIEATIRLSKKRVNNIVEGPRDVRRQRSDGIARVPSKAANGIGGLRRDLLPRKHSQRIRHIHNLIGLQKKSGKNGRKGKRFVVRVQRV